MSTLLNFTPSAGSWTDHYHITNESVTNDGDYAEWILSDETNHRLFGLNSLTTPSISAYEAYIWPVNPAGQMLFVSQGTILSDLPIPFKLFDRFRLTRQGTTIVVTQNGSTIYTFTGIPASTCYAHTYSDDGTASIDLNSVNGTAVTTRASASVAVTLGPPTADTFAGSSNLLFTPLNCIGSGNYRETAQPCAGYKFKFTGSEAWAIFDARQQVAVTSFLRTWLSYRVDGGSWTRSKITDETLVSLKIATGLSSGTHEAEVQIADSSYGTRWAADGFRYSSILFYGARIPATESLSAPTAKQRSILFYGDSNSQGAENQYPNNNGQSAYAALIAAGINADLSLVSYPGQGWITTAGSDVPTFENSWDLHVNNASRLTGGDIVPEPTIIAICHGQNDASDVTAAATSTINAILAATTTAKVVVMCPAGRHRRTELIAAVSAVNSPRCVFFDNPTNWLATYGANGATTHLTDAGHVQYANVMIPQFSALFPAPVENTKPFRALRRIATRICKRVTQ